MTTVATVAGHFPLVLVSGPGAEARNSIGLVLVGGMAIGTLFTLFVIPSIYMLIARDLGGKLESLPVEKLSAGSANEHTRVGITKQQDSASDAKPQLDTIPTLRTSS